MNSNLSLCRIHRSWLIKWWPSAIHLQIYVFVLNVEQRPIVSQLIKSYASDIIAQTPQPSFNSCMISATWARKHFINSAAKCVTLNVVVAPFQRHTIYQTKRLCVHLNCCYLPAKEQIHQPDYTHEIEAINICVDMLSTTTEFGKMLIHHFDFPCAIGQVVFVYAVMVTTATSVPLSFGSDCVCASGWLKTPNHFAFPTKQGNSITLHWRTRRRNWSYLNTNSLDKLHISLSSYGKWISMLL